MYIYPMGHLKNHQQDEEAANEQGNQSRFETFSKT